jgi:hypothetical protein
LIGPGTNTGGERPPPGSGDLGEGHAVDPVRVVRSERVADRESRVIADDGEPLAAERVDQPDQVAGEGAGVVAVVIGEYERAFYGDQFARVSALLDCFGVPVWLPEAGGRVDMGDAMHRALVTMLGAQSLREVLRSRHRVLAAMRAQTREQGR